MTKKKQRSLATKAKKLFRALDAGRSSYRRADELLKQMREAGLKPGDEVVLNAAGDKARLKDNFTDTDKVFRSHGISRFELELLKA
jgi:hypothetical protein